MSGSLGIDYSDRFMMAVAYTLLVNYFFPANTLKKSQQLRTSGNSKKTNLFSNVADPNKIQINELVATEKYAFAGEYSGGKDE